MKGARSILLIPRGALTLWAGDTRLPSMARLLNDGKPISEWSPVGFRGSLDPWTEEWALLLALAGDPLRISVLWLHDTLWPGQVIGSRNLKGVAILVDAAEAKGLGRAVFLNKQGKEMER